MKKGLIVLAVVGVVALAGMPAYAQGTTRVNVPFAFIAGDTVLPAGHYTVTKPAADLLTLRSADGKAVATVMVQASGDLVRGDAATFSFRKMGGQYFLAKVGVPGTEGRTLLLPKRQVEAMLAKLNGNKAHTGPAL